MTSEKFTTIEVKTPGHEHPEIFRDWMRAELGKLINIGLPDSKEVIQISNIPVEEAAKIIDVVRDGGGEIIEN